MLSLTKKSDAQQASVPHWHANFRNFERLPDTKVVRTTFFINTAVIAVTVSLLLWLGYREYHLYNLGVQIADAQREIDNNTRQNKEALRLTKIFDEEQKKLTEAAAFLDTPISPVEYVNLIGQTLPKEISIESTEARMADPKNSTFVLRGFVAGTPDQASGTTSSYVDTLRANPRLGAVFDSITLTNLNRDPSSGFLVFEILLKVNPSGKGKK